MNFFLSFVPPWEKRRHRVIYMFTVNVYTSEWCIQLLICIQVKPLFKLKHWRQWSRKTQSVKSKVFFFRVSAPILKPPAPSAAPCSQVWLFNWPDNNLRPLPSPATIIHFQLWVEAPSFPVSLRPLSSLPPSFWWCATVPMRRSRRRKEKWIWVTGGHASQVSTRPQ